MADFPLGVRGYHRDEVDAFISRIEGTLGRSPLYAPPVTAMEVDDVRFASRLRGYRMRAVDAALDAYARELEGRGGRRRRMAAVDVDKLIGMVRNVRFATTRFGEGYDEANVDAFLDKMILALRGHRAMATDVRAVRFPVTRLRRGYRQPEVDAFLEHLATEIERIGGR